MQEQKFKTKLSKKQKQKNIIYGTLAIILTYIAMALFLFSIGVFENASLSDILLFSLAGFFFTFSILGSPVIILASILGWQRGRAKRIRDNSTIIKVQSFEYYRDILNDMNPATVSILIDLDLYGKKDIVATLVKLYNKGAISFESNGKIEITANNTNGLGEDEVDLMNLIYAGHINDKDSIERWKSDRFMEAKRAGYISQINPNEYRKPVMKKLYMALLFTIFYFVLWGIGLSISPWNSSNDAILIIGLILFSLLGLLLFIPWYQTMKHVAYYKRYDMLWRRTELGNQEAEKIAGLQKFIQDFSLLDSAQKEAVKLWDDYLIYAIVLEDNEEIVDDICSQYHISL